MTARAPDLGLCDESRVRSPDLDLDRLLALTKSSNERWGDGPVERAEEVGACRDAGGEELGSGSSDLPRAVVVVGVPASHSQRGVTIEGRGDSLIPKVIIFVGILFVGHVCHLYVLVLIVVVRSIVGIVLEEGCTQRDDLDDGRGDLSGTLENESLEGLRNSRQ